MRVPYDNRDPIAFAAWQNNPRLDEITRCCSNPRLVKIVSLESWLNPSAAWCLLYEWIHPPNEREQSFSLSEHIYPTRYEMMIDYTVNEWIHPPADQLNSLLAEGSFLVRSCYPTCQRWLAFPFNPSMAERIRKSPHIQLLRGYVPIDPYTIEDKYTSLDTHSSYIHTRVEKKSPFVHHTHWQRKDKSCYRQTNN